MLLWKKSFFSFSGFNRLTPQCHQCHQNPNHGMNAHNWKQLKAKQRITSQCNASKCISPVPQFSHVCTWVYPCQEPGLGCLENTRSLLGQKKSTLLRFFGGGQQIKNRVHCGKTIKIFSPLSGEWVVVSWKYLDVTSSPRRWRAMVSGQGSWEKSIKARYQVSFHQFHYVAVRYQCLALTNHHLFQKTNICWLAVYKFAINQFELSASVTSETDIFWESLMERKYWKSTSLSIKSPGLKASK